jgi:hypothetical protein
MIKIRILTHQSDKQDPHFAGYFDADPDPACLFDADPDLGLTVHFDADPYPDLRF